MQATGGDGGGDDGDGDGEKDFIPVSIFSLKFTDLRGLLFALLHMLSIKFDEIHVNMFDTES